MADVGTVKTPSLVEDYLLKGKEVTPENTMKPVEEAPVSSVAEEVGPEKTEETPAIVENSEAAAGNVEASSEASDAADEETSENAPAAESADEEDSGSTENETLGDQHATEEAPEIKLETAPADFRFPTTNQTRHCFTRYIEYHRCVAAKGSDDAPECQKFAKYYRSLCPGEWIDRWNEQRENGTFPGPL